MLLKVFTATGYQILMRYHGVDPVGHYRVHVANTGSAATSYTVSDLSPDISYVFRVKAHTSQGPYTSIKLVACKQLCVVSSSEEGGDDGSSVGGDDGSGGSSAEDPNFNTNRNPNFDSSLLLSPRSIVTITVTSDADGYSPEKTKELIVTLSTLTDVTNTVWGIVRNRSFCSSTSDSLLVNSYVGSTSGTTVTVETENANNKVVCFKATRDGNNFYRASSIIRGIDRTAPSAPLYGPDLSRVDDTGYSAVDSITKNTDDLTFYCALFRTWRYCCAL